MLVFVKSVNKWVGEQDELQLRKSIDEHWSCSHTASPAWVVAFIVLCALVHVVSLSFTFFIGNRVTYMTYCIDSLRPPLEDPSTVRHCGNIGIYIAQYIFYTHKHIN